MEKEKKEIKDEKVEGKPTDQGDQPGEKKPEDKPEDTGIKDKDPKEGEEEVLFEKDDVKYTAKSLEALNRKATDFDGIIEKRRIEKLLKKDEVKPPSGKPDDKPDDKSDDGKTIPLSEVKEMVKSEVAKVVSNLNTESYNENFTGAYQDFIKEHSWANTDEIFDKIKDNFSPAGQVSKEGLLTRLKLAAQNAYPNEYLKIVEERAKSRVLLEEREIEGGDGGGGSSIKKDEQLSLASKATKEDIEIANEMFDGDVERYMKNKTKD